MLLFKYFQGVFAFGFRRIVEPVTFYPVSSIDQ